MVSRMSVPDATNAPQLTVLVCTYNRRPDLMELLASVAAQEGVAPSAFEVVVVDNNSKDGTREAVQDFTVRTPSLRTRYFFEGRQGKSNALQLGLAQAWGEFVFVLDSDQLLPPNYIATVLEDFRRHPEVSIIGGRVLPRWSGPVPGWLTPRHWSAVAMLDYGSEPVLMDRSKPLCLLAASFRLSAINRVGGFRPELGVSAGRIGSVEDVDIINRILETGAKGLYDPALWLEHKAEPDRMTKRYHRRWHYGHGRFFALLGDKNIERCRFRLFGVPSHFYRDAARNVVRAIVKRFGPQDEAFEYETGIWFFAGFFRERITMWKTGDLVPRGTSQ
jgi:glycosyltransferase involved in cell wall biosynthesis